MTVENTKLKIEHFNNKKKRIFNLIKYEYFRNRNILDFLFVTSKTVDGETF